MAYDKDKGTNIVSKFEELRTHRRTCGYDWRMAEAYRYTFPERGIPFINQSTTTDRTSDLEQARLLQARIFDTTLIESNNVLSRSLYQGATPPQSMWFDWTLPGVPLEELAKDVSEVLEKDALVCHQKIHSSNYDAVALEIFLDYTVGGMTAFLVELNNEKNLFFEPIPMWSLYVQSMLKRGVIDTAYRSLSLTPSEAAAEFGLNNLPKEIRDKYEEDPQCDETDEYIHCVKPRMKNGRQVSWIESRTKPNNKRWESCYVTKTGEVVREGGYDRFPFVIPRYRNIPESEYGIGPTNDCLPDQKTLNVMIKQMLQANEIAISPPLKVRNDGVINPRAVKVGPRAILPMQDPSTNMVPLHSGARYEIASAEIVRMQDSIRRVMMAYELEPINKKNSTAYEVNQYYEIMRQRLGPTYNRMHNEMIKPMVQLVYWLLEDSGQLTPNKPALIQEMLDRGELPVPEYKSPLARAGRIEDVQAVDRLVASVLGERELNPDGADLIDFDEATRLKAKWIGASEKIIRSKAKVKAIRDEKEKMRREMQQAAEVQIRDQAQIA